MKSIVTAFLTLFLLAAVPTIVLAQRGSSTSHDNGGGWGMGSGRQMGGQQNMGSGNWGSMGSGQMGQWGNGGWAGNQGNHQWGRGQNRNQRQDRNRNRMQTMVNTEATRAADVRGAQTDTSDHPNPCGTESVAMLVGSGLAA